jgi:hypothetical protein
MKHLLQAAAHGLRRRVRARLLAAAAVFACAPAAQALDFSASKLTVQGGGPVHVDGQGGMSPMHIANDEFDDGSWHALDACQPARVLLEGNAFEGAAVPILDSAGAGFAWGSLGAPTAAHRRSCATFRGRDCIGNLSDPAPQPDDFRHDLTVLDYFQKFVAAADRPAPFAADAVGRSIPFLAGPGHL